jgi:hypothetical protein
MSKKNTPEDFWARVSNVGKEDICWEWQGHIRCPGGYGDIKFQGKRWTAHRLAHFLTYGLIPQSKVKHTCDNPLCCNPAHLYVYGDEVYQNLIIAKFWANVDKNGALPINKPCVGNCWTWLGKARCNGGYGKIATDSIEIRAHRFSYELAYGAIPNTLLVCHKCDNPLCVNPDHLFAGTSQDNVDDMIAKDRNIYGEKSPKAKLTEQAVKTIRSDTQSSGDELAERYGIRRTTVYGIRQGSNWKHVK